MDRNLSLLISKYDGHWAISSNTAWCMASWYTGTVC
jgi:hypothetical protein